MGRKRKENPRDNPFITDKEVLMEIKKRGAIPYDTSLRVLNWYYQIVEECVANGVEVKTKMGNYSWKQRSSKSGQRFFNAFKREWDYTKEDRNWCTPMFYPSQAWKKRLKAQTMEAKGEDETDAVSE